MKNISLNSPVALVLAVSFFATAPTQATLLFTSADQSTTIDFDTNLGWESGGNTDTSNDVFRRTTTFNSNDAANARKLLETGAFSSSSTEAGGSTTAFSWRASGINLGVGVGVATPFADDYNSNSDETEDVNVIAGLSYGDHSAYTGAAAGDEGYLVGENGGNFRPFRSYDFALRLQNVSGSTISEWSTSLDGWWVDEDNNSSDVTLAWSLDNVTYNVLDTFTTTNNGTTVTERDLTGSFSADIGDDEFLYLKFSNYLSGGSGSGSMVIIDNWNVTSIPEPSSLLLFGMAILITGVSLRRKSQV